MTEIEALIQQDDDQARLMSETLVCQMAKQIGAAFVATNCQAEAIVLTGEWVRHTWIRNPLRKKIGPLAPVTVYQEALDMQALAQNAIQVLNHHVKPQASELPKERKENSHHS